jgi:hypothetical protein
METAHGIDYLESMSPYSTRRWAVLVFGILLLLESGCECLQDRDSVCQTDALNLVVVPATPECEKKMTRLASQLEYCENQWRWTYEHWEKVSRLDRAIADLNARHNVSSKSVRGACQEIKGSCFLGEECEGASCFARMQCEL